MSVSEFVEKDIEMTGFEFAPFAAVLAIIGATLVRGIEIRRATGDRPWAFTSAKGVQRLAGASFALSVAVLILASAFPRTNDNFLNVVVALLALIGAAIVIVAQIQMGRAWRVGVREGDSPLFVSHGLFRYSRNPIFVGMMFVGFAAAMVSGTSWSWAALAAFMVSCAVQVGIEEKHLEVNFGEPYRDFRASVPRWIGPGGSA